METNPQKRWNCWEKSTGDFWGWYRRSLLADSGIMARHPLAAGSKRKRLPFFQRRSTKSCGNLGNLEILWKFIIRTPSLSLFGILLGQFMLWIPCCLFHGLLENQWCVDDFPSYKPLFIGDFQLPCLITGGSWIWTDISWILYHGSEQVPILEALSKFGLTFCSYAAHRAIWKHRTQYCPPPELHTS